MIIWKMLWWKYLSSINKCSMYANNSKRRSKFIVKIHIIHIKSSWHLVSSWRIFLRVSKRNDAKYLISTGNVKLSHYLVSKKKKNCRVLKENKYDWIFVSIILNMFFRYSKLPIKTFHHSCFQSSSISRKNKVISEKPCLSKRPTRHWIIIRKFL